MNLSQVCIENKYEYKFRFNILKLSIGDLLRKMYLHSILMKMFGYFQDVLSYWWNRFCDLMTKKNWCDVTQRKLDVKNISETIFENAFYLLWIRVL